MSAGTKSLSGSFRRVIFSYKKDFGLWRKFPNSARGLNSVETRKPDIKQDQVRLELLGLLNGNRSIAGFAHDLKVRLSLQRRRSKATPRVKVVYHQNTNCQIGAPYLRAGEEPERMIRCSGKLQTGTPVRTDRRLWMTGNIQAADTRLYFAISQSQAFAQVAMRSKTRERYTCRLRGF